MQRVDHLRTQACRCNEVDPYAGPSPCGPMSCCCVLLPHLTHTRVSLRRSKIPFDITSCPSPMYDFLPFPASDTKSTTLINSRDLLMSLDLETACVIPIKRGESLGTGL